MALSCTQGFRIVSWFSVEMEIRTAMTGRFGYSPVGHCMDRSDLFENATLRESDDGKTGCFRLRLWRSLLSLLTFCFAMGVLSFGRKALPTRKKRSPSRVVEDIQELGLLLPFTIKLLQRGVEANC